MNTPADIALAWLQRARSDLQLGRAALRTQGVMPEDVCFHAQQCAEKALKAFTHGNYLPKDTCHRGFTRFAESARG